MEDTGDKKETEQEDNFNRARSELERAAINYEMTSEEARAERRKRRERIRDSSGSSEEEEPTEHHTRSRDVEMGGDASNAGAYVQALMPTLLTQQSGESEKEKGKNNHFVIKVEINVVK